MDFNEIIAKMKAAKNGGGASASSGTSTPASTGTTAATGSTSTTSSVPALNLPTAAKGPVGLLARILERNKKGATTSTTGTTGTTGTTASTTPSTTTPTTSTPATTTPTDPATTTTPTTPVTTDTATTTTADPLTDQEDGWSVEDRLNNLLSSDSRYIQLAKQSGMRTAASRGLLNSSLAAGSAEAAAIAAGLPIASQDAQVVSGRNQSKLEGGITRRNSLDLQAAQDLAAGQRLTEQLTSAEKVSKAEQEAAMARQQSQNSSAERQAALAAQTQIKAAQISADSNLTSSYLGALGQLSSNAEMKAADRAKMIAEFQRVTNQGTAYTTTTIPTVKLTY